MMYVLELSRDSDYRRAVHTHFAFKITAVKPNNNIDRKTRCTYVSALRHKILSHGWGEKS